MKQASAVPPSESAMFCDPVSRRLPCNTKAATFLSALYFYGQLADGTTWPGPLPAQHVEQRLQKAAQYFQMTDVIAELRDQINARANTPAPSLADKDFALTVKQGSETIRRFPIINRKCVKIAAANLFRNRASYPFAWRKQAARAILERAVEYGVTDIDPDAQSYLSKAAGLFPRDPLEASRSIALRAYMYPSQICEEMLKAAWVLYRSTDGTAHSTLCDALDTADRETGLHAKYARLAMPEDILFMTPVEAKSAAATAADVVTLANGDSYRVSDLARTFSQWGPIFSELPSDAASDSEKLASLLPQFDTEATTTLTLALKAARVPAYVQPDQLSLDEWLNRMSEHAAV